MKKAEFELIKGTICAKIGCLYEALRTIPGIDSEPLNRSKQIIISSAYNVQQEQIYYTVENIRFTVSASNLKHLSAEDGKPIDQVELYLSCNGILDANLYKDDDKNPWKELSFKAELVILTMGGVYSKIFHVDQICCDNQNYGEVHPFSHLHFMVDGSGTIDLPRLVHYPFDIVLGLSVALQNYLPDAYAQLKMNSQYIGLCYQSQKRLLKPYIEMYCNGIDSDGKANATIKKACPYLL